MRFCLDHDVAASVADMLRRHGHEALTAGQAGLAVAGDDEITVWAYDLKAVLVTMDRRFSQARARRVIGKHVWLRCPDPDAAEVLELHLDRVVMLIGSADHVLVRVSRHNLSAHYGWA